MPTASQTSPALPGAGDRRKILFVSESITLAQVVRLVTLARSLNSRAYEVHFAAAQFPERIFRPGEFQLHPLFTVSGEMALRRLDRGGRLYDVRILRRYVAADREVIQSVRPDLIVGDLRWSLAVSAPLEGVPFAVLANAYMSPHARRDGFPLPDHPIVQWLGERLAARYFPRALPKVFEWFARPLNQLRRRHQLPPIGDLLEVLTFGDLTLYADAPELTPMRPSLPPSHKFLGHVPWSPDDPLPPSWGDDPKRAPIYVTLGSSGDIRLLPRVLDGLRALPVDVLVATAGRAGQDQAPFDDEDSAAKSDGLHGAAVASPLEKAEGGARIAVVPFVSGARAASVARLVISNGGSSTGYQALAAGCPVLGLPHNLEQHMAMAVIENAGAGRGISARNVRPLGIRDAVREILAGEEKLAQGARAVALQFAAHDPAVTFPKVVGDFFDSRSRGANSEAAQTHEAAYAHAKASSEASATMHTRDG